MYSGLKLKSVFTEDLVLGVIYVPPEGSRFLNDQDLSDLEREISNMCISHSNLVLTGDTNGHTGELDDLITIDNFLAEYFDFDEETIFFSIKQMYLLITISHWNARLWTKRQIQSATFT